MLLTCTKYWFLYYKYTELTIRTAKKIPESERIPCKWKSYWQLEKAELKLAVVTLKCNLLFMRSFCYYKAYILSLHLLCFFTNSYFLFQFSCCFLPNAVRKTVHIQHQISDSKLLFDKTLFRRWKWWFLFPHYHWVSFWFFFYILFICNHKWKSMTNEWFI